MGSQEAEDVQSGMRGQSLQQHLLRDSHHVVYGQPVGGNASDRYA